MEKISGLSEEDDQMELPPGFRFHPTDEELITHYLSKKVLDSCFCARAIGEVDLNKVEPWDLPWRAKMGEREWYFFCVRDRKYPTGLRTNRATDAGYWKATGKDREIYRAKTLVGMKKTLVFYRGRAPKGQKSNWVMHEFRLEGSYSLYNLPKSAKNDWVICRIFHKSEGGKKMHISGLVRMSSFTDEPQPSNLPPLMDCSGHDNENAGTLPADTSQVSVSCFSDPLEDTKPENDKINNFNYNSIFDNSSCSNPSEISPASLFFPKVSASGSPFSPQFVPNTANLQYPDCGLVQDQSIMRFLHQNNELNLKRYSKPEFSWSSGLEMGQRSYEDPMNCAGPVDLDCLWNY